MKIFKNKNSLFLSLYIIQFIIIVTICLIISFTFKGKYSENNLFDSKQAFNTGWYNKSRTNITLDKINKGRGFSTKYYSTFEHKIPNDINVGDSLCFRALSTDVKVYINNKLILDTPYKESVISCKSSGSVWYFYKFKKIDIGKTLKIKIKPYYNDNSCYIAEMYVCDSGQYMYNIFTNDSVFLILSFLILIIGLIFIISDLFINKVQGLSSHALLYIGIFSCSLGIWCSTSTHVIELVTNKPQMVQTLACNALYLIPLPCVLFLDNLFDLQPKKIIHGLSYTILSAYGVVWLLQLTNISDFHQSLPISYFLLFVSVTIIVIMIIISKNNALNTTDNQKIFVKTFHNIIFISTAICVFTDMYLFLKGTTRPGFFVSCDMILIIIYLSFLAILNLFKAAKSADHAKFVQELAYKDGLTNIGNRTAYKEKIADLEKNIDKHKYIGIVIFDVNNLKNINDNYGHLQGDKAIIATADIISKSFENFSTAYRIGGDEFAVIIDAPNAEAVCKVSLMQFKVNLHNYNMYYTNNYNITVAHGEAFYSKNKNVQFMDIIKEADMNMYKNKKAMKENI